MRGAERHERRLVSVVPQAILRTLLETAYQEAAQLRDYAPVLNADFRSPKSINILGLLEKLTGTGRPQGDSATKE